MVVWSRGVSLVQMVQHWTIFNLFVNLERYVVWLSCTIPFILVNVYSSFSARPWKYNITGPDLTTTNVSRDPESCYVTLPW